MLLTLGVHRLWSVLRACWLLGEGTVGVGQWSGGVWQVHGRGGEGLLLFAEVGPGLPPIPPRCGWLGGRVCVVPCGGWWVGKSLAVCEGGLVHLRDCRRVSRSDCCEVAALCGHYSDYCLTPVRDHAVVCTAILAPACCIHYEHPVELG